MRLKVGLNCFALFVDGAVKVKPLAAHLEVGLVHAPGIADRLLVGLPAFFSDGVIDWEPCPGAMPQALAPQGIKGNGEFIPMTAHVARWCKFGEHACPLNGDMKLERIEFLLNRFGS